jgi:hypothetical protein
MQAMEFVVSLRARWRRLLRKVGRRAPGLPTWGEGSPTILGVCTSCGAVVLKGWHREGPGGLLCRRCADKG